MTAAQERNRRIFSTARGRVLAEQITADRDFPRFRVPPVMATPCAPRILPNSRQLST